MKLKDTLVSRRRFLNSLVGGGLAALAAALLGPILRFLIPPYREPDEVRLPLSDYKDAPVGEWRSFAWGIKPGFLRRAADGSLSALVGVCTHLDCNVKFMPEVRRFYCACHQGWYDEAGTNIAGPPPKPLRRLAAAVEGEEIVVRREG